MSTSSHRRWHQEKRPRLFILGSVFLLLLFFGWVWFRGEARVLAGRTTVVVALEPVVVVSWDDRTASLALITIPEETVVEALFGYGRYSLRGLWELGKIDAKEGLVLSESVGEALGIPVPYYVGPLKATGENAFERVRDVFSFSRTLGIVAGTTRTNLPLRVWFGFMRHIALLRPDRVTTIELSHARGIAQTTAPDGSTRLELDPSQVDVLIGDVFEDEAIRREALPVAVYNTTEVATLGTRAARLLSTMGFVVVAVDNAQPQKDACEAYVRAGMEKSASVVLIRELFDCTIISQKERMRADIMVYVGSSYASRFLAPDGAK
jgi:hypothetical protein